MNPALLRNFSEFYHRTLSKPQNNQIWMVTHSDTLLRQAVGKPDFSLYHLEFPDQPRTQDANQAVEVRADEELERALIDMVGDLATYTPRGKVVLFEGGGGQRFDVTMVSRLFPTFAKYTIPISAGSKSNARSVFGVLGASAQQLRFPNRFFVVVDGDGHAMPQIPGAHSFAWDVYHIENYLLAPQFVRSAAHAISNTQILRDDTEVERALREAALAIVPSLVLEETRREVNSLLVQSIDLGTHLDGSVLDTLLPRIQKTYGSLDEHRHRLIEPDTLAATEAEITGRIGGWLDTQEWKARMPGRKILKRFVDLHLTEFKVDYLTFRNVILDKLVDAHEQPAGMKSVIDAIMATPSSRPQTPPGQSATREGARHRFGWVVRYRWHQQSAEAGRQSQAPGQRGFTIGATNSPVSSSRHSAAHGRGSVDGRTSRSTRVGP